MQQLNCPNCGSLVSAENINIQKMTAVCGVCATVFQFDTPEAETVKAKRRKVKQPQHLELHDGRTLEMAFRTNWRLDQDNNVQGIGVTMGMMLFAMGAIVLNSPDSVFAPLLLLGTIFLVMSYALALRLYNQTQLEITDDRIQIVRQPLPNLSRSDSISLSGVTKIVAEETKASIENEYDTPRFAIWAERADDTRRLIVTDLVEDYAYFVAQQLDQRLHAEDYLDTSRLVDAESDFGQVVDDMIRHDEEQASRYS